MAAASTTEIPIQGVCPIVATPFDEKERVDFDALDGLVHRLIDAGCHALTLFGIASEYHKLCDEERNRMASIMTEACQSRGTPSILSVTDHATTLAVRRAQVYQDKGTDCLMLLPPFFLKPDAASLREHIVSVARAVKIPIMLQYAPEQTGVTMSAEALAELQDAAEGRLIYKIESRPPGPTISRMMQISEGRSRIFVGNAGFHMIEGMERGAVGVMPGCSMCELYLRVYNTWQADDKAEAVRVHQVLLGMLNHIAQKVEQIIAFEKRTLKRRGWIPSARCRRPTVQSDEVHDRLYEMWWAQVEAELQERVA